MTGVSSIKVSLLSVMYGWLFAFLIYVIVDLVQARPPETALDWIVTDIFLLMMGSPVAVTLCFVLWVFVTLLPRSSALWYGALLMLGGGLIGWSLAYAFAFAGSILARVPRDPLWPSPINFGSLAGFAAFAVAYWFIRRESATRSLEPTSNHA